MWMSYLQRWFASFGIPGKSTQRWVEKPDEVEESQSSTLLQGAELLPQSSHGETEGGGHSHKHTHTCLIGVCVCLWGRVGLRGGRDVKEKCSEKVFGNCRHIFKNCCKLRSHPFCTSVWMLWQLMICVCGMMTGSCSVSWSLSQKQYLSAWIVMQDYEALDTHHYFWPCSDYSTHSLFSLYKACLVQSSSFFFDGKNEGWKI